MALRRRDTGPSPNDRLLAEARKWHGHRDADHAFAKACGYGHLRSSGFWVDVIAAAAGVRMHSLANPAVAIASIYAYRDMPGRRYQPGDVAIFAFPAPGTGSWMHHCGVITRVDKADRFTTLEANTVLNAKNPAEWPISVAAHYRYEADLLGYVRPQPMPDRPFDPATLELLNPAQIRQLQRAYGYLGADVTGEIDDRLRQRYSQVGSL